MITLLIHDQCEVRSAPEGRPAMAAAAPRPFGALLKRYRQAAGLTQEALAGQAGLSIRTISDLVRLLPELAQGPIEPLPAWTLPPAQERRLLFAAVARLLGNVAGPGGTLLLLDDLQWADPDALALLASLLHSAAPLRVLGAYRDTEVQPEAALEAAGRARLLEETAQGYRFAHDVIAEVVEAELSGLRRRLLHRRVAAALEQQPGAVPVEALAYHYRQGEMPERALPYLVQAGDRAKGRYAYEAAEGYYRAAVAPP